MNAKWNPAVKAIALKVGEILLPRYCCRARCPPSLHRFWESRVLPYVEIWDCLNEGCMPIEIRVVTLPYSDQKVVSVVRRVRPGPCLARA